jgi:DNA primase
VYIKECSTLMEVQEQMLMSSLNKLLFQRNRREEEQQGIRQEVDYQEMPAPKQVETETSGSEYQERDLVRIMLMYANYEIEVDEEDENGQLIKHRIPVSRYIIDEIYRDEMTFRNPVYQQIFDEFDKAVKRGEEPDEQLFIRYTEDMVLGSAVIDILSNPYELSENWLRNKVQVVSEKDHLLQAVENTLLSFKAKTVDRMIGEILKEMKESTDAEDIMILQSRQKALKDISRKINARLGRIIIK